MSVPTPHQDHTTAQADLLAVTVPTRISSGSRPVTISPGTLWLAMGIVLLAAIAWVVISNGASVLILLFTAIIIGEGLRPVMNWLHERLRLPQLLALLLVYALILLVFSVLAWLLFQAFVVQISTFGDNLPRLNSQLARQVQDVQLWLGDSPLVANALAGLSGQAGALAQGALALVASFPQKLGSLLFDVVVIAVMAFFWLTGVTGLRPFILGLLPASSQPIASAVLDDMGQRLGGYLRGVIVNGLVIGVLSALGDWLLGAPFPLVLGLVAGITQVIPYFGPWISGAVAVVVVLPLAGPLVAVEVLAFYIVLQTIEGNTLTPLIMMGAVDINPLLAIVAVLFGSALLGIAGAVLAVPAVAILQVLVVQVFAPIARRAAANVNVTPSSGAQVAEHAEQAF
jgi:predicted PurR-regulated permease PerM